MSMSQMMLSLECIVRKVSLGSRTGRGGWLAARKAPLLTKAWEQYYFLTLPQRSFSLKVFIGTCLWTHESFIASFLLCGEFDFAWARAGRLVTSSSGHNACQWRKYTTSRQPGSKSLQFFFACEPGNLKALYSPCFNIKLEFGDCGPVCPGGAAAQALKKDCATSYTGSVPFRNSELAKIKQLCRNILL